MPQPPHGVTRCPSCGQKTLPNESRCPYCGARLNEVLPAVAPPFDGPPSGEEPLAVLIEEPAPAAPPGPGTYGVTDAPVGRRCPVCDAPLAAKAVLCVRCGYDFRLGKARATVVEAPPGAPRRARRGEWATAFPGVLLGLTLYNARVLLSLLATVVIFAATAVAARKALAGQEPPLALVLAFLGGVGLELLGVAFGVAGAVLCLGVPRDSGGRLPLALALILDAVTVPLAVVAAVLGWPPLLSWGTGLASWALFVGFLVRLAEYIDRPDEASDARNLFLVGVALVVLIAGLAALALAAPGALVVEVATGAYLLVCGIMYLRMQFLLLKLLETLRESIRQRIDEARREPAEDEAGGRGRPLTRGRRRPGGTR
jgi:hypothetical protein